jgi:hypothetical protein
MGKFRCGDIAPESPTNRRELIILVGKRGGRDARRQSRATEGDPGGQLSATIIPRCFHEIFTPYAPV